jgi:hypothetical protein
LLDCVSVCLSLKILPFAYKPVWVSSVAVCLLVLGFSLVVDFFAQFLPSYEAVVKIFKRPVLKHGPRSLTYVQVLRW